MNYDDNDFCTYEILRRYFTSEIEMRNTHFRKLRLAAKPPQVKIPFSHWMKFWKVCILGGGLTLVPRCKRQG